MRTPPNFQYLVARLLFVLSCFGFSTQAQTTQPVTPILNEVIVNPQAQRATAYFGYTNPNASTLTIRVGEPRNFFDPPPEDRGQTEQFLTGTRNYAFAVVWNYSQTPTITWYLDGSFVTADVAAAGANTPQTSAFTYQGRLTDAGTAASGTYQMRFTLFDVATSGTQIGNPVEMTNVSVNDGVFTVQLDFGSGAFANGADKFLNIEIRRTSNDPYTALSPRQQIGSMPYATRAFSAATAETATNAQQLGGASANSFVQTNDARLSNARPPTAGSTSYIQNTTTQQSAGFNISGSGTVGGNLTVGGTASAASFSGDGAALTGIFSIYSLNAASGSRTSNPSGYSFIGTTHTITLTANQRLTGAATVLLSTNSGSYARPGLCYQIGGGVITNFAGSNPIIVFVDTSDSKVYSANATVKPGAGTVTFGLCVGNFASAIAYGNVNGWMMVTNN